ncbi:hypothetical protein POF50_010345 [Streptomyces sp. SL13]|uniref:DUF6545 domain-containing protein n=1 Tax=Streptantibioticus silvisoli TaxID=2705255 RepID=A0AA90KG59_9ACTN|nr:MAB_1171c family putative transporter [Streptantibioticus silvisoli]MDI5969734.1 hypothetical protein [Streptantibioticus silvisoli]
MGDAVACTAVMLLAVFGVTRLIRFRGGADPAQRYVGGFSLCLAASLLLLAPGVLTAADRLTGRPVLLVLVGDTLTLAASNLIVLLAVSLPAPPARPTRHALTAVAVQLLSIALFAAADPGMRDASLTVAGAGRQLLAAHDALFAGYGLYGLALLARELNRGARSAPPGPLRTGLRITTCAAFTGMLWAGWTADDVVNVLSSGVQFGGDDVISNTLAAVTALLTVSGTTVMRWSGPLGAPARWLRAYRRHRALEPLWAALHAVMPEIALAPADPGAFGCGVRGAEFALYRRIIEIRDGALALRPWSDPRVADWAAADGAAVADAAVLEAAGIAAALEHRAAGRAGPGSGRGPAAPYASCPMPGTVDAEALWLLRVTAAFTGSPAVAAVRGRARAGEG